MPTYAADTNVPAEKSRAEIERTLARYGAQHFMYGWDGNRAVVMFRMGETYNHRQVRFVVEMPNRDDREFTHTPERRYKRSPAQAEAAWEQATRQRWRALALVVKAKLEAVEAGIASFDQEFLAHIMLPSGETVGEWIAPGLEEAYTKGEMPSPLMLALPSAGEA